MLPLLKPSMFVEYTIGNKTYSGEVYNSNPTTVWVYDSVGKILKIHKRKHKVKIVEGPEEKGGGKEKPQGSLDDLISGLSTSR